MVTSTSTAELQQKKMSVAPETPEDHFFAERVLALVLIILTALWLRAQNPGFSTAYMDESVYIVYGRMFLARHFEAPLDSPLRWSFGWYLWPMISAIADRLGGIVAVREVAAAGGTTVVLAVYGISRRLYGVAVGLGAAAVFAVLGPAVYASRIATRDAGAIFFFALGLWAYVMAWQERKRRWWLGATILLFAAFLCKYIVAIYFPALVIIALWRGWRPFLFFAAPMTLASAFYLLFYWGDLKHLLLYGEGYGSLRASGAMLWDVYVGRRIELWVIGLLALLALVAAKRGVTFLLVLGAAIGLVFQWKTRSDFDFWKHAAYALLFLTPAAVHGVISATRKIGKTEHQQVVASVLAVIAIAAGSAWAGKSTQQDQFLFWPNVEPILGYFEGRLPNNAKLLVDDSVFRYYFHPMLRQSQIADPFYFHYGDSGGKEAYAKAVQDGWFDYLVMDGGMGQEADDVHEAIRPYKSRYALRMAMPDPVLGRPIEIYERVEPPASSVPPNDTQIEIMNPGSGATVPQGTPIEGRVVHAPAGAWVQLEILSNRWYTVGKVPVGPDGSFKSKPVNFGGQGVQACNHVVRARLYNANNTPLSVAIGFNIAREGAPCPVQH
jgi:ABC-type thiamin/hydroxymethylpyrimidine transport system permease subunit